MNLLRIDLDLRVKLVPAIKASLHLRIVLGTVDVHADAAGVEFRGERLLFAADRLEVELHDWIFLEEVVFAGDCGHGEVSEEGLDHVLFGDHLRNAPSGVGHLAQHLVHADRIDKNLPAFVLKHDVPVHLHPSENAHSEVVLVAFFENWAQGLREGCVGRRG